MAGLLEQIRALSPHAAHELESEAFISDSDIRSLDRQDLLELLPGKGNLRLRKDVHKIICGAQQQTHKCAVESLLKYLQDTFPPDSMEDVHAPSNRTLLECLRIWKKNTEEMISLLEKKRENPSNTASSVASVHVAPSPTPETSATDSQKTKSRFPWVNNFLSLLSQDTQGNTSNTASSSVKDNVHGVTRQPSLKKAPVTYRMIVSGKTLDKHLDVIEKLNGPVPQGAVSLMLTESLQEEQSQVTIVFCPVVSRAGTDVDAALQDMRSDKPVILVAMHHMHSPKELPAPKTKIPIHLGVNVFFHETVGLIDCTQNNEAINKIKTSLLHISNKRTCDNPQ